MTEANALEAAVRSREPQAREEARLCAERRAYHGHCLALGDYTCGPCETEACAIIAAREKVRHG